jgi:glycosyltransferase involved in cell wall biosynthesis
VRIALIGNYAPDRQESMQRYAQMLATGLVTAGHDVRFAVPRQVLNRRGHAAVGIWKWLGYLDKYGVGLAELGDAARAADVVHICDHSNAVYVPRQSATPHVVTCHDLLAVRAALGEDTDCPASFAGTWLQKAILRGLTRADAVTCVSRATLGDARRLLAGYRGQLMVVPNALNHPYRQLSSDAVSASLSGIPGLRDGVPYVLHVGSNLRRKNRPVALEAVASISARWPGRIAFAGEPLSEELRFRARKLGVEDRVVEVARPDNRLLEALYGGALALVFPSRFEGFGWPIAEAQAAGCPVICSDRHPFPEVAGGAAIMCAADDHEAFGRAVLDLAEHADRRAALVAAGLINVRRYEPAVMIEQFVSLYRQLVLR